ncbi:MAG TPA: DUF1848 domain-containing protein [Clostridia bacterium]|nr:DUF1848 domain-containing protein [Clostridia bacterium]
MADKWEKVFIKTKVGIVDGVAPVIISASRSTDIPAFYSDWFMNRLSEGYVKWVNPFNSRPQYISFEKARVIVFWTKDAEPIVPYLEELDKRGINYYFSYTVNDYGHEGFEPGVRSLENRADTFRRLSEAIGRDRVIWRFDPLVLTDMIDVDRLLDKVYNVGRLIAGYTKKLVLSFADISSYAKVSRNLLNMGINVREFTPETMDAAARGLNEMNKSWGLELATCCEEIDLSRYNIKKNKCIDDDLMIGLFSQDKELMGFLGFDSKTGKSSKHLKDRGQRQNCGCVASKDIGRYDTCDHRCVYCYANSSPGTAHGNYLRYLASDRYGETIV